jgi:hypothetical protein
MIWLWQMFDRSPLGQNSLLGHRFRRMLAPMIFRSVGENFKCWHFVEWSFGYNLSFRKQRRRAPARAARRSRRHRNRRQRFDFRLRKHLLSQPRHLRHPQGRHARNAHRKRRPHHLSRDRSRRHTDRRQRDDRHQRRRHARRRAESHRGRHSRKTVKIKDVNLFETRLGNWNTRREFQNSADYGPTSWANLRNI